MIVAPADERQRRVLYAVFGMLLFVLVLMFLSQGRRAGRPHPEDLDLSFRYEEKDRSLTVHLFKTPRLPHEQRDRESTHPDGTVVLLASPPPTPSARILGSIA